MTESEFCLEVLHEPYWIEKLNISSYRDRPKLISAFRKLIKQAGDDLDHLGEMYVFSPSEDAAGTFLSDPSQEPLIYLSPYLDRWSQATVDYAVAHEFGHAVAHATGTDQVITECVCGEECGCDGHPDRCKCEGCRNFALEFTADAEKGREEYVNYGPEYAADSLVLKWGFDLPPWRAKLRVARAEPEAVAAPPLKIKLHSPSVLAIGCVTRKVRKELHN
jgi:hypothetical protein